MKLVVVEPFHDYKRGDVIADDDSVESVLNEHPRHVVVTPGDPEPISDSFAE